MIRDGSGAKRLAKLAAPNTSPSMQAFCVESMRPVRTLARFAAGAGRSPSGASLDLWLALLLFEERKTALEVASLLHVVELGHHVVNAPLEVGAVA